ncbi:MAG: hypothetical protein J5537_06285 [Lachnospiraceae bacterium]|nr:hypothetical protein [Lachnospiraceae bacterium]
MAKYQPPVGYEYDPNTGLYFNQVRAVDENGQNVRVITWFNADTGEYTRDIYPDGVNNAANNYDQQGAHVNGNKAKKAIIALVSLAAAGLLIFFGIRFIKGRGNDSSDVYVPDLEAFNYSSDSSSESNDDSEKNEPIIDYHNPGGDLTTIWDWCDEREGVGYHYNTVWADDEYVYAFKPFNSNFSFGPAAIGIDEEDGAGGMPYGSIIRFKKDGSSGVETVVSPDEYVYTFCLMGDYLYYSTGDYRSSNMTYIQRNKNTGEEQVFLQDEYSLLVPYEGRIYLWLRNGERRDLLAFNPETGDKGITDLSFIDYQQLCREIHDDDDDPISDGYTVTCEFGFMDNVLAISCLDDCFLYTMVFNRDTWDLNTKWESYIIPEIPSAGMGALGLYDRELFSAYENTGFNPDMISIWSAFGGNGELFRYNEERRCECAYGYRGFEFIGRTDEVFIIVSYKIGDHNNTDMRVCMKGILGDREYDYRTDWPDEPDPEERLMIRGDNYFVGFEANWLVFSKYAFHIDPYTAEYTVLELN